MKFLKFVIVAVLFVMIFFTSGTAQNTAPEPVPVAIMDPDNRPTIEIAGELFRENAYGTTMRTARYDRDSVNVALGYENERRWRISMDSLRAGTADTTLMLVTVTGESRRGKPAPFTPYKDSLFFQRRMETVNSHFIPGIHITMEDSVSNNVAVGDTVYLAYLRRSYDRHWLCVTQVHPSDGIEDTILVGGAPIAVKFANNYEFLALRFEVGVTSTDTTSQWGLGLMYKNDGDARWSGEGNDAIAYKDSCKLYDADFTPRVNAPNHIYITHSTADSVKCIFYTASSTGRQILRWVEAWQSN